MGVTWTKEQQQVIDLHDRDILVSAAAGSGKTAVLVERILAMITRREDAVDIDHLLVVTFTRAAAGEMKERILQALELKLAQDPDNEHLKHQTAYIHNAQINTIDGFCAFVIRNYFYMIDLDPGYRIADEGELKLLKADVLQELLNEAYEEDEPSFLRLVESYAPGKNDEALQNLVLQLYELSTSNPWPSKWLRACRGGYRIAEGEAMEEQSWMKLLWEDSFQKLADAEQLLESCLTLANEEDGPHFYLEALEDDARFLEALREMPQYDEWHRLLQGHKWARLSQKKDPNAAEEKKTCIKAWRDELKGLMKELGEQYFFMSEQAVRDSLANCAEAVDCLIDLTLRFLERFTEKKRQKNLMDFTDMEHLALQILVEPQEDGSWRPTQAARELAAQFEEILIDEYQDSNYVQELLLCSVSRQSDGMHNIFMVGDVKQSIYRFRLANPELFLGKYDSFSTEDSLQQRIDLHKNFRSRGEVLAAVNLFFEQLMSRSMGGVTYDESAALHQGADYPEEKDNPWLATEVLLLESDRSESEDSSLAKEGRELEARMVGQRIAEMVGKEQVYDPKLGGYRTLRYSDCVILLRSISEWGDTFGQVLGSMGIPAYVTTRSGYFSALEVATLLNYLQICDNPRQDIPLAAVLHSPLGQLTAEELAGIRLEFPQGLLYDGCLRYREAGERELLREKLDRFLELFERIRDRVPDTPIHQLILLILEETGYGQYVQAMPAGEQRWANVQMLVERARDYERTSYRGLFHFIRYIEYLQKYNVDFGEASVAGEKDDTVRIMTIHKSKGLEFPVVIVAGMGKRFNMRDLNSSIILHPQLGLGADSVDPERRLKSATLPKQVIRSQLLTENLGEEMRVLYVALTRAKEKLILAGTVNRLYKRIGGYSGLLEQNEPRIPLYLRRKARDYWDWILPALVRHEAFAPLLEQAGICGIACRPYRNAEVPVQLRIYDPETLTAAEVWRRAEREVTKEYFLQWDENAVYHEQLHRLLEERFSFVYPYEGQQDVPVKQSVSELKQQRLAEPGEEQTVEPDVIPLIPRFVEKRGQTLNGAGRGTAYHRVLELLDYGRLNSLEDAKTQLTEMEETGKLEAKERACVQPGDILAFVQSSIGQRLQAAAADGRLFREQAFAMSVPASEKDPRFSDCDTIVIQGIIDAFFYEQGQIVLVDYKTDRVKSGWELVERYRRQLEYYAQALERTTGKPVCEKIIYSVTLREEVSV